MLLTQYSSDRGGNGDGALKKSWTEVGARWFLIGFDRRGLIAHLSEFFWTRDWNPPLFGLGPLVILNSCFICLYSSNMHIAHKRHNPQHPFISRLLPWQKQPSKLFRPTIVVLQTQRKQPLGQKKIYKQQKRPEMWHKRPEKTIKVATKEHDEAAEKLNNAEQSQKDVQEKWDVIDLVQDVEDESNSKKGTKKRAGLSSSEANANKKSRSDSNILEEILVEGCGLAEVNGSYKRVGFEYWKEGQFKGEDVRFQIYRRAVWVNCGVLICGLYSQWNSISVPRSNGWKVHLGVEPAPKITAES
eukprot:scaffold55624_cov22-Cyclotella_meneghiniana.AAC.1